MIRRFTLAGFVGYVTVFGVFVLLAGLWLNAALWSQRWQARYDGLVDSINLHCSQLDDGSGACAPGTWNGNSR